MEVKCPHCGSTEILATFESMVTIKTCTGDSGAQTWETEEIAPLNNNYIQLSCRDCYKHFEDEQVLASLLKSLR